ncbi:MAG: DUF4037 domain-containing protein [Ardenticatenaceae bacterium]|nr:DUF4037 domain-containing protein [Ardenticatenaceae bacterium]
MNDFIPGLRLNEQFFGEVIRPLLHHHYPHLTYCAARIGSGSDVLGYDTPMSTDHDWGIRQQLFLREADFEQHGTAIHELFRQRFPPTYQGYSVHFGEPDEEGTRLLAEANAGAINHRVEVTTIGRFLANQLPFDPLGEITAADWLVTPQQKLLEVTRGQVFVDDWGELTAVRQKLAWYPHDIWLYLLMAQWSRIGQEEHFLGRTGYVDDDLGSQLLAGRLVHDVMLLCFLMEKRFAPYPKWFGTAFKELTCYEALQPTLRQVLLAEHWQQREKHLRAAYEFVAQKHNELGLTEWVEPTVRNFFGRPFQVINAGRFATPLYHAITDETVRQIKFAIGSIDQFSDNTDMRENLWLHQRLRELYR